MLQIIAVGKKHEAWVEPGLERYQKRLKQPYVIKWSLVPHSAHAGDRARLDESERILVSLTASDFVVLLDETGKTFDSPALADFLEAKFTHAKNIVFVIGGAYGVSEALQARADTVWSLSPLVFAHQLVRLILVEQLYRAQEISRGGGYHHS